MYDSLIDRLIDLAIEEDIATGDITTNAIIPVHAKAVAEMKAKADGVISGLEIAKQVFERFEKDIVWEPLVTDGTAGILSCALRPATARYFAGSVYH